jgi:PPP family 3-phenylpropionic acid transporter
VPHRTPLPRFLIFYAAQFAAFGVALPFLPGLLKPWALGIVLAGGTAIRLLAGPWGGRLADRTGRPSVVLAGFAAAAALIATGYASARGLPLLLAVSLCHAAVLAPLTPVADAMALGSADVEPRFRYGWVRGAGSAAFVAALLVSGRMVAWAGLGVIVWLNAGLLAVAACLAPFLPDRVAGTSADSTSPNRDQSNKAQPVQTQSVSRLLRIPVFVRMMAVVALIGGSHALHDGFEVIRWRSAGMSPGRASELWALSVAAELSVFVFLGAPLLGRIGPARAMMLAAAAGMVRWGTAALTASFSILVMVEPLHGLTFALLHLACMNVITRTVPAELAATAQAFYATVAMGATTALVTLASGPLYGHFGAAAFWAMATMCALALPLAVRLRAFAL